jgi:L-amino acid N-acyltransferase YncA
MQSQDIEMDSDSINIRPVVAADAEPIAAIYNPYVLNTTISFEETEVTAADMRGRIADVQRSNLPWLVAEDSGGNLVAYAYASPWKSRSAYRFAVEVSVYAAQNMGGRGIGKRLYEALFAQLRQLGIHTAIGGIAQPNPPSVALHERMGMKRVALFEEVGYKFGQRVDVGYWQVRL